MLFPQFSLRWLLGATTAFGGFFLLLSLAAAGHIWATAISVAVFSLALVIAVHVCMFFVVWLFSLLIPAKTSKGQMGQSPFAPTGAALDRPAEYKPAVRELFDRPRPE